MLKIVQAYVIGENGVNVIVNTTDTVKGYTAILNKKYGKNNVMRVQDITNQVISDYNDFYMQVSQILEYGKMEENKIKYILALLDENRK